MSANKAQMSAAKYLWFRKTKLDEKSKVGFMFQRCSVKKQSFTPNFDICPPRKAVQTESNDVHSNRTQPVKIQPHRLKNQIFNNHKDIDEPASSTTKSNLSTHNLIDYKLQKEKELPAKDNCKSQVPSWTNSTWSENRKIKRGFSDHPQQTTSGNKGNNHNWNKLNAFTSKNLIAIPNKLNLSEIQRKKSICIIKTVGTWSEEDVHELTNTEEIGNFWEYTEVCLQKISWLHKQKTKNTDYKRMEVKFPFPDEIGPNKKRVAVFDWDETLIHCQTKNITSPNILSIHLPSNQVAKVGIFVRPWLAESLRQIQTKYYLIAYTASQQAYADTVLNYIDPKNEFFVMKLYRHNCVRINFKGVSAYVKDWRIIQNVSLKDMVIIDNSVWSFALQINNGIPILPYYNGEKDKEWYFWSVLLWMIAEEDNLQTEIKKRVLTNYYKNRYKNIEEEDPEIPDVSKSCKRKIELLLEF